MLIDETAQIEVDKTVQIEVDKILQIEVDKTAQIDKEELSIAKVDKTAQIDKTAYIDKEELSVAKAEAITILFESNIRIVPTQPIIGLYSKFNTLANCLFRYILITSSPLRQLVLIYTNDFLTALLILVRALIQSRVF